MGPRDERRTAPAPWPLPVRVVIEVASGLMTPFNLVPVGPAQQSRKLMVLACLPLQPFGGAAPSPGWPPQLAIDFWSPDDPLDPVPGFGGLVWWVSSPKGLVALSTFEPAVRERCIVVVDEPELIDDAHELAVRLAIPEVVAAVSDNGGWRQLPTTLYGAIVRHQGMLAPEAHIPAPNLWSPLAVPRASTFSMAEWLGAAEGGDSSPAMHVRPKQPVSGDLVVRPNQILRGHALGQVPDLDLTYVPGDPEAETVALARSIMDLRWRRSMLAFLTTLGLSVGGAALDSALQDVGERAGLERETLLREALFTERASQSGRDALERLLATELPWRPDLVVPQLVLACPSTSIAFARRSTYQRGPNGAVRLKPQFNLDDDYVRELLEVTANATGRMLAVPAPGTPEQEALVRSVVSTVQAEADWLTACGFMTGARYGAPVLKTPRVAESTLEVLRRPLHLLEQLSSSTSTEFWVAAADAVRDVGEELVSVLPAAYGSLIDDLATPWIHCLSDIPFELVNRHGDLFAYQAALSRTPITPGITPLVNFRATRRDVPLPGPGSRLVIATPFDEGEAPLAHLLELVQTVFPRTRLELVADSSSLASVMEHPDTALVIYLGHATYDADNEESVLHLRNDTFGTFAVRSLERVPPLVFLVGCTTSGAGSTLGSLATALLVGGARAVVGTSYPVRQSVAYHFLPGLLRQLAAQPEGRPVDLARATLRARRNVRLFSDLRVLVESNQLDEGLATDLMERYIAGVGAEPSDPDRGNLLAIEARLLGEAGVIDPTAAPSSWGIVPYPAFFSVLGMPWSTLQQEPTAL